MRVLQTDGPARRLTDVLNDKYAQHTITAYALLRYGIEKGIAPKSGA